ncbi:MAG: S26 family signal peptidase [Thermogutta sp.]
MISSENAPSGDSVTTASATCTAVTAEPGSEVGDRSPVPCRTGRASGGGIRFLRAAVLLIAAVLTADGLFVTSLRPHRVQGGSMVPWLIGGHQRVRCDGCGREFCVLPMPGGRLPAAGVCPFCGRHVAISPANAACGVGDLVWILRGPYFFRHPRRWEAVGLRDPAAASRILVKRIVGLPGETVAIREGDLFVNGEVCRKPWPLLRAMSAPLPLAEDFRRPRPLPCEVRLTSPATNYCHFHPGWDQLEFPTRDLILLFSLAEFSGDGAHGAGKLRIWADDGDRGWVVTFDFAAERLWAEQGVTPARDDPRHHRNPAEGNAAGDAAAEEDAVRHEAAGVQAARLQAAGDEAVEDDAAVMRVSAPLPRALRDWVRRSGQRPPIPLAVSLADRRLLVAVQDRTVLELGYDPPPLTRAPIRPFALDVEGATGRVTDVQVLRDAYYLPPYQIPEPTPQPLPAGKAAEAPPSVSAVPDEPLRLLIEDAKFWPQSAFRVRLPPGTYLVLGDDAHSSLDGRYWRPDFGIPAELILGRTLVLRFR